MLTVKASVTVIGKISSTDPISFENRFRILPDGLVLKKYIGAYTIFENMLLCKFVEALMQKLKKMKERNRVSTIMTTVNPEYI